MYTPRQMLMFLIYFGLFAAFYWLFDGFARADYRGIHQVGFMTGLWHGAIWPVSLTWSLFDSKVVICASYGNGAYYNCGFTLTYTMWLLRWFFMPLVEELDPALVNFDRALAELVNRITPGR